MKERPIYDRTSYQFDHLRRCELCGGKFMHKPARRWTREDEPANWRCEGCLEKREEPGRPVVVHVVVGDSPRRASILDSAAAGPHGGGFYTGEAA